MLKPFLYLLISLNLLFSKYSKLLFYKSEEMSDNDAKKVFRLIEENL